MKSLITAMLGSTAILRMMTDEGAGGSTMGSVDMEKLAAAVAQLDPANDDHWLADGRARVEAVEAIYGDTSPTREQVDMIGRLRNPPPAPSIVEPRPIVSADTYAEGTPERADYDLGYASGIEATTHVDGTVFDPADSFAFKEGYSAQRRDGTDAVFTNQNVLAGAASITKGRVVFLTLAAPFDGETEVVGIVVKVAEDGSANVKAFAPNGGADMPFTGVRSTVEVDAMPDGADKNAARTATWSFPPRA